MRRSSIFLGVLAVALAQRASAQDGHPFRDPDLRWSIAGGLVVQASVPDAAYQPADVGATVGLSVGQAHRANLGWVGAVGFTYFGAAASPGRAASGLPLMIASQPSTQIVHATFNASWLPRTPFLRGTTLVAGIGEYRRWVSGTSAASDAFGINAGIEIPIAPRVSLDASLHKLLPGLGPVGWMCPIRLAVTL